MAKKQPNAGSTTPTTASLAARVVGKTDSKPTKHPSARGGRETVDALAVAVVLALLIRTFQAEAFVIPTGSMAPTLMGKHKDVYCDQCGQRFKVNASDEDGEQLQLMVQRGRMSPSEARRRLPGMQTVGGVCPQCHHVQLIRSDGLETALPTGVAPVSTKSTYSGDRLVVNKYHYSFFDPERWDIAVFKYPGKAQTNYIKRLVGLPNEALRLVGGDLFVADGDTYAIAKKPPETLLAMSQHVHDTDRDPAKLHAAGWPLRWNRVGDGWEVETRTDGANLPQRYIVNATEGERTRWLHYSHTPPSESVWEAVLEGESDLGSAAKPSLVTDFIPYNTRISREQVVAARQYTGRPARDQELSRVGLHWVGDLMLEAEIDVASTGGEVALELVEAGDGWGVAIDVATGEAAFYRRPFESEEREALATAKTIVRGASAYTLRLANFDDRLVLWVNGAVAAEAGYDLPWSPGERLRRLPKTSDDDPGDLAPARVGVRGAKATVERLLLKRDTYYIADSWRRDDRAFVTDHDLDVFREHGRGVWRERLVSLPRRPEDWDLFAQRRHADFSLGEDQFFVLGDNSPESLDARLWFGGGGRDPGRPGGSYLERDLLVGKAICVYWPHSWYSIPLGPVGLPLVPNLPDMRLVR